MKNVVLTIVIGILSLTCGCASDVMVTNTMVAKYSSVPVNIDGKLDDAAWADAEVYQMNLSRDKLKNGEKLVEAAKVKLAWDDKYFYVGVDFEDSDIVAEGDKDQLHHYSLGDVCELFLKPADSTWYWELYVTPHSKKTSFFIPGRGRLGVPSTFADYKCGLTVAGHIENGTLNNWEDRDNGWTAEMAMPIKDLTSRGNKFCEGQDWRILVARYNYSRYFDMGPELSMTPSLSATSYHLVNEYAVLRLQK